MLNEYSPFHEVTRIDRHTNIHGTVRTLRAPHDPDVHLDDLQSQIDAQADLINGLLAQVHHLTKSMAHAGVFFCPITGDAISRCDAIPFGKTRLSKRGVALVWECPERLPDALTAGGFPPDADPITKDAAWALLRAVSEAYPDNHRAHRHCIEWVTKDLGYVLPPGWCR